MSFIDLETAAARSGKSAGHLSRTAKSKWQAQGKARLVTEGGKRRWQIREDADSAFTAIKNPEQIRIDLRQYTAKQRDLALSREKILRQWGDFCRHAFALGYDRVRATHSYIERLLIDHDQAVSARTLYNWNRAYRLEGLAGLIDGRTGKDSRKDAAGPSADEPDLFLAEVQRLYLSNHQPKLTEAVRMAAFTAREQNWTVRSYKTCQRHINRLPAGLIIKTRLGEDAYVAKAEPYIEKDYTSINSNDAWTADHHQMDVIVNADGELVRPWLSVFMDIRSRKIMGWALVPHAANSDTIISVFRAAVLAHGVPRTLYIDNGKDYDCYALNGRTKKQRWSKTRTKITLNHDRADGIFPQLGVEICHVWPYHGQSKPVEPWFKNPESANRTWATYCGSSPVSKPEDLQLELERGHAPKLADYRAWFADWLAAHDGGHQHQGDGMDGRTPDHVWNACLLRKVTADESLLDLLCLKRCGPVRVGRNGVQWQQLRYGQYEPRLHQLLGKEVYLRVDERQAGHVQVYSAEDQFLCIAQSNEKLPWGANQQDLRAAIADKKKDRKLLNTFIDRRPRIAEDLPDRLVRAAAQRAAAVQQDDPAPPPSYSIAPVQHPLSDQLPALQRALEAASNPAKTAVGAEGTTLVDVAAIMGRETENRGEGDVFARLAARFREDD